MISYSACNTCGQAVIWARRPEVDRWHPPLDPTTAHSGIRVDEDSNAVPCVTYTIHQCRAENIEAFSLANRAKELARANAVPEPVPPVELDEDHVGKDALVERRLINHRNSVVGECGLPAVNAMDFDCPLCGTDEDQFCTNMSRGKLNGEPVMHPHKARIFHALVDTYYLGDMWVEQIEALAGRWHMTGLLERLTTIKED